MSSDAYWHSENSSRRVNLTFERSRTQPSRREASHPDEKKSTRQAESKSRSRANPNLTTTDAKVHSSAKAHQREGHYYNWNGRGLVQLLFRRAGRRAEAIEAEKRKSF